MILACKARYNHQKEVTRRRFIFEYRDRYYFIESSVETVGTGESGKLFNIEKRKLDFIDCALPIQEKREQAVKYGENMKGRHLEYPSTKSEELYETYVPILVEAVESNAKIFKREKNHLASRPHSLYVDQKEFYYDGLAFPIEIDDIDTISVDNLSLCSGDTEAEVKDEIRGEIEHQLEENMIEWPEIEKDQDEDEQDAKTDWIHENSLDELMYSEHIYYNKVLEALDGKRVKCDIAIVEKEIDKLTKSTRLHRNLALVIFRFTYGIIPTKEEMRRRRMELWKAKFEEINEKE